MLADAGARHFCQPVWHHRSGTGPSVREDPPVRPARPILLEVTVRPTHLAAFEQDAAALVDVLRTTPLDVRTPSCPGWRLSDLGAHVGQVHRMAAAALAGTAAGAWEADGDLAGRVEAGAAELHGLLVATDPDAPCRGLDAQPQAAAFWVRRLAHETALHRWDAEVAAGRPAVVDPVLALDGVAEVAAVMYPRQLRLGRREPLGAAVELVAPEGRVVLGEGAPVGRVHGPAEVLLLAVWGRQGVRALLRDGTLTADGDVDAVVGVLDQRLVP